MKRGWIHALLILGILCVSVVGGILIDSLLTKSEYAKYPQSYSTAVTSAAEESGVPEDLLFAICNVSSHFDASLCSEEGKIGLMQISPDTYRRICDILPDSVTRDPAVLYDPVHNLSVGAAWLWNLFLTYGDWDVTVVAFYAGADRVDTWLKDPDVNLSKHVPDDSASAFLSAVRRARTYYRKLYT